MTYLIEIRLLATNDYALVKPKGSVAPKTFSSEKDARLWGRANLEDVKWIAMWQPISAQQAIRNGYEQTWTCNAKTTQP